MCRRICDLTLDTIRVMLVIDIKKHLVVFFNDPATTEIYTLSLHDALPIYSVHLISSRLGKAPITCCRAMKKQSRSEEHTSELQSLRHLVCRLLLEKKK